jgi:serine/threonine-protein kinase
MAGGSLRDRLKRQQGHLLRLADCKDLAIAVARALCAAQQHEIIHRNITTGCILFDEKDQAKLGDFTLAKGEVLDTFYDITRGKLLPGDYLYQSPEILSGSSHVTIAADFYSLAVCLFEALAGSVPFDRDQSDASMIAAVSRTAWPPIRECNPEVPLAWQNLIAKNLSRDPDDRSSTAEELLNEIRSMPDEMDRRRF